MNNTIKRVIAVHKEIIHFINNIDVVITIVNEDLITVVVVDLLKK
jgi:hypothetical protein